MSDLANGTLVQHNSLGLGKVIAVEPTAVHVFFPESERRYAVKLRWPLTKALLKTEGVQRDTWLEGLSSFSLVPETGRYALAENWLSHDQAVAEFLAQCPGAFAGGDSAPRSASRTDRAARWRAARAGWIELLGGRRGEALLADGAVPELVRRALRIERLVAPIAGVLEEGAMREAFRDAEPTRLYFEALFELLSVAVPGRAAAERLFAATNGMGAAPSSAWTLATLFPFLADPARHLVLRPRVTRAAAERLGCDLRYDPAPNWATYAALRKFAGQLLERLKPIGARDLIDVEAFLHVLGTRRPAAARAQGKEEAGSRPAAKQSARRTRGPARARARARG
jgi:hypothetical protein